LKIAFFEEKTISAVAEAMADDVHHC